MSQESSEQQQVEEETAIQTRHLWKIAKYFWSRKLTPESFYRTLKQSGELWDVVNMCGFFLALYI